MKKNIKKFHDIEINNLKIYFYRFFSFILEINFFNLKKFLFINRIILIQKSQKINFMKYKIIFDKKFLSFDKF